MATCGDVVLLQCCPFAIEREVHLASQALPAAGAYTTQVYTALPPGTTRLAFWTSYTRGAVGGYPGWRVQWGNGTESNSRAMILDEGSLTPALPSATAQTYQETLLGPIPQDGTALTYLYEFDVPPGATEVRLQVAEVGITATPGTAAIAVTGLGSI